MSIPLFSFFFPKLKLLPDIMISIHHPPHLSSLHPLRTSMQIVDALQQQQNPCHLVFETKSPPFPLLQNAHYQGQSKIAKYIQNIDTIYDMTMKVFMKVYLKSDVFVGVDFPGRVGNADVRLPVELQVDFGVFGVFVGDDRLTVVPGQSVAVVDVPHALAAGLVVLELAGVAGAVLEDPLAFVHLPLDPAADQLHARVRVDVGALAVLLVELPPPRVAVAVRVHVGALAVLVAVLPLPVVLALASVGQLADSVLHVASEVALVLVPVGVDVLALAFAHAIVVLAVVLVVVGVNSIPPSGVVSGVLAFFSAFLGELVGLSFSLFCHQFQIIIIDKFKLINHFQSKSNITLIFKALVKMPDQFIPFSRKVFFKNLSNLSQLFQVLHYLQREKFYLFSHYQLAFYNNSIEGVIQSESISLTYFFERDIIKLREVANLLKLLFSMHFQSSVSCLGKTLIKDISF